MRLLNERRFFACVEEDRSFFLTRFFGNNGKPPRIARQALVLMAEMAAISEGRGSGRWRVRLFDGSPEGDVVLDSTVLLD